METGLKQLDDAATHGLFSAVDAVYYQCAVQSELFHDVEAARKIMEPLAERFPGNPEYQLFLSRLEYFSGKKEESGARVLALLQSPQAQQFPGLRARAVLNLTWDAMREQRYADALELANTSEKLIDSEPLLESMRSESLLAQAEANKAVGEIETSFERFGAIPADDPKNYKHAQNRIAQIKKETGWLD
jgi:predicted Zn-dependent protease